MFVVIQKVLIDDEQRATCNGYEMNFEAQSRHITRGHRAGMELRKACE
jgi:hypothetical protein